MRRRFGPYEEVNVAIAALVLGGPESVRALCVSQQQQSMYLAGLRAGGGVSAGRDREITD